MPRGFSDYDAARVQGRLWTPEALRPALWLDAADLSTITIATGVSEWRDKSGNGWNVVQGTAGNQPDYSLGALNGLNVLTYTSGKLLQTASNFTVLSGNPSFSTFALYRTTTANAGSVYGWGGNTGSTPLNSHGLYGDGTNQSYAYAGGNSFAINLVPNNEYGIMTYVKPAGAINVSGSVSFRNGTANNTGTPSSNTPNISSGFPISIGRWADYTLNTLVGDLAEFLILGYAASARERLAAEGYLSWKWGIRLAADHPFANRPPLIGD